MYKFIIAFCIALLQISIAHAEVKIIETEDSYIIDNKFKLSMEYATEQAREKAMQKAAEEAGIFVKVRSKVEGFKLTEDKVETLAASILEVLKDEISYNAVNGNKNMEIICKIKVKVDTDKIDKEALFEKDELLQKIEDKNKLIRQYEAKIKQLENQDNAVSKQVQDEISENQRQFLIAKYERDIDIYDFNRKVDTQKLMETAQKLSNIDPQNAIAFRATIYCLRMEDKNQRAIDYSKQMLNAKSIDVRIEACTQIGDIYYNEYNDKATAKKFVDQGIALVKSKYSPNEIEKLVNGSNVKIQNLEITGKSNTIRELYALKSELENISPSVSSEATVKDNMIVEDNMKLKYRTDW